MSVLCKEKIKIGVKSENKGDFLILKRYSKLWKIIGKCGGVSVEGGWISQGPKEKIEQKGENLERLRGKCKGRGEKI